MAKAPCSDLAKLISDLALAIGERKGMNTLDKITVELQKHIPMIRREEIARSIVEATKTHASALSEIQQQVAAIKREAGNNVKLLEQIDRLEKLVDAGARLKGGFVRQRSTDAIELLRTIRDGLKKKVGPSQAAIDKRNAKTLKGLEDKLSGLEKNLVEGTEPAKGERKPSKGTKEITEVREKIVGVEKEIRDSVPAQRRRLLAEMKRLADKLEAVESVPPAVKKKTKVSRELDRLVFERDRAKLAIRDAIRAHRPQEFWSRVAEPTNLARSIMTGLDVSGVFRQGGFLVIGDPVLGSKAIKPMLDAFSSEQKAREIHAGLIERHNAPLHDRYGLFRAEMDSDKLNAMEEAVMSKIAGKIPLIAGSQRAYVTYLNVLRADAFDGLMETLTVTGEVSAEEGIALANFINIATGRGPLGKVLEQAGPLMNTLFFAPRLVASRMQLLALPFTLVAGQLGIDTFVVKKLGLKEGPRPFFGASTRVRKEIAKIYGRYLAGLSLIYFLAFLAGGDAEEDPRSSDFGKVRFGKTRVDPLSGISQVVRLVSQQATGEKKSAGKDGRVVQLSGPDRPFRGDTRITLGGKFIRTKFSPAIGAAVNVLAGEDVVGQHADIFTEQRSFQIPLVVSDVQEAMVEHGVAKGTALGMLAVLGMGVSTFQDRRSIDVSTATEEELGKFIYGLTDPSDDGGGFDALEGVPEKDATQALRVEFQRRSDARAQRLSGNENAKGKPVRRFTTTGKPTAYGRRVTRMLQGLRRAKKP